MKRIKRINNIRILFAIFLFCVILCSCNSKKEKSYQKTGDLKEISIEQIINKIQNEDTFILQFTKTNCPYCLQLEKVEKEYLKENDIIIYVFSIDKNIYEFKDNQEYFNNLFGNIDHVPIVYWLYKGEPKNNLPIVEEKDQIRILKYWIRDNLEYYK